RVLHQRADLLDVLRLRPREFLSAVGERHARARSRERDRGLQRRIAASHDQELPSGELLRVVEPVADLVRLLAGDAELPVAAAPAHGDERAPRAGHRFSVALALALAFAFAVVEQQETIAALD